VHRRTTSNNMDEAKVQLPLVRRRMELKTGMEWDCCGSRNGLWRAEIDDNHAHISGSSDNPRGGISLVSTQIGVRVLSPLKAQWFHGRAKPTVVISCIPASRVAD
jgi:hypothetical protein